MFWKILWASNLIVFAIDYILVIFMSWKVSLRLKANFPDKKPPKMSIVERIYSQFKAIITHLMPILNLMLLFIYLFEDEMIMEKAYLKVKNKLVEKEK